MIVILRQDDICEFQTSAGGALVTSDSLEVAKSLSSQLTAGAKSLSSAGTKIAGGDDDGGGGVGGEAAYPQPDLAAEPEAVVTQQRDYDPDGHDPDEHWNQLQLILLEYHKEEKSRGIEELIEVRGFYLICLENKVKDLTERINTAGWPALRDRLIEQREVVEEKRRQANLWELELFKEHADLHGADRSNF
jgi:hypothetical protein